jgi:hypothetical protein
MHFEIVHRHGRQVGHEAMPHCATIDADPNANIRSYIKQVGVHRIFADHMNVPRTIAWKIAGNGCEGDAAIGGHVHIRLEVAGAMAIERDVENVRVVVGGFYTAYICLGGHAGESTVQLGPLLSIIVREPHSAVVCASDEHARHYRRFSERHNGSVSLGCCCVRSNTARCKPGDPDFGSVLV